MRWMTTRRYRREHDAAIDRLVPGIRLWGGHAVASEINAVMAIPGPPADVVLDSLVITSDEPIVLRERDEVLMIRCVVRDIARDSVAVSVPGLPRVRVGWRFWRLRPHPEQMRKTIDGLHCITAGPQSDAARETFTWNPR